MDLYFGKTYKQFSDFISTCEAEIIIICPYIKLHALQYILKTIPSNCKLIIIARWKLSDLVFGSSDLEVYQYLKKFNCQFYVNRDIHLKVLIKDKKEILLGSANITGSGLGLHENSNIEAITIDDINPDDLKRIFSIMRNSILVDDELFEKISFEYNAQKEIKKKNDDLIKILEKKDIALFKNNPQNLLVFDFPFSKDPEILLENIKSGKSDLLIDHDINLFNLNAVNTNVSVLRDLFLNSKAYMWQKKNIKRSVLFGKYSELLHNALMDDPRPYRRQVKELVSNMFTWTELFSDEFTIKKHKHTKSIFPILNK